MGVSADTGAAGNAVADRDHRPPLGEARSHIPVFGEAVAQAVQALGDLLSGKASQRLGSCIHLDPGDDPAIGEHPGERPAVISPLPDGLVEQDDATDELLHALGGKEQLPVSPPAFLGGRHADGFEALPYGGGALVGGQNPFPLGD